MVPICCRFQLIRDVISFSSEKVLLSGVAYTITLIYIICLISTYLLGESLQAHAYLLWEALFLFIILVINFLVAFNEEYLYRNEIPHRVRKVLGEFNWGMLALLKSIYVNSNATTDSSPLVNAQFLCII